MILFNKKHRLIVIFCICLQQFTFAQVKNYTKIDKIYRDTYNFLDTDSHRSKQYKDKGLYVVYSDRTLNNAYLDELGLKQGEKQDFLTPYYVIKESSDFLELVKLDPSVIGKPKGIFSFFYGDTYNFSDVKKVEYVGWIKKSKLLHFSHPKISEANLKPLVYYLGVNDIETLYDLRKFVKKDTIVTYKDPSFKIKSNKSFNINQLVYLYKYNTSKTAALISNLEHMHAADSTKRIMGWVPARLIKNIGQRKVWSAKDVDYIIVSNNYSINDTLKTRDIKPSFLFQPEAKYKQKSNVTDSTSATTHIPLNIWDHYNNKLINVNGGDVLLREIPKLKEENNTFNFHFVFDCSEDLKQKLALQITSLQRIWLLISEDERFANKQFTFSASSYGCGKYYEFSKSKSFALWIDYLQKVFLNDKSIQTSKTNTLGLEKCLVDIIDSQTKGKDFENNIVIIAGEANLSFNMTNNEQLLYDLSKVSARILFFQLENQSDKSHQDFVLQAKQVLDDIGNQYTEYVSHYIINNKDLVSKNLFLSLESQNNNIYLHDAPKNSMYTGGIVFPRINQKLNPVSFDVALDSLLSKTIAKNNQIITSLEKGSDKLGFLRSQLTQKVTDIITKGSTSKNALLISKINKDECYLETLNINLKENKGLESGYLLTKNELDVIIESYKSVIPLIDKTVNKKQRKQLFKKYKQYYKQLNKLLFYKELKKKNTIGELLEIKTGISVEDPILNTIKIKHIHRKSVLSNAQYKKTMQSLRSKTEHLETIISSPTSTLFIDGGQKKYYYVSTKILL